MFFQYATPGQSALVSTKVAELFWGGDASRIKMLQRDASISSAAVDAANTPTWQLRKGLLMGKITSSAKYVQWDSQATNGSQWLGGVLPNEILMQDSLGTATDGSGPILVSAPVKASALLIKGAALVGHADEYLARRGLAQMGFKLDDDIEGFKSGQNQKIVVKSADYTIVAGDNSSLFMLDTANATLTLPAIKAGLSFEALRVSDHNTIISSAEGDNIVFGNDASGDSITFNTAGQKIGARVRIRAEYYLTTLKWIAEIVQTPFSTGASLTIGLAT
jgi:hypothetical protein